MSRFVLRLDSLRFAFLAAGSGGVGGGLLGSDSWCASSSWETGIICVANLNVQRFLGIQSFLGNRIL